MAEFLQHFLDTEPWSQNIGQAEINLPTKGRYRDKYRKGAGYKRIMSKLSVFRERKH